VDGGGVGGPPKAPRPPSLGVPESGWWMGDRGWGGCDRPHDPSLGVLELGWWWWGESIVDGGIADLIKCQTKDVDHLSQRKKSGDIFRRRWRGWNLFRRCR
jgi:hypothetical protein